LVTLRISLSQVAKSQLMVLMLAVLLTVVTIASYWFEFTLQRDLSIPPPLTKRVVTDIE
jgi:hypothetical protein